MGVLGIGYEVGGRELHHQPELVHQVLQSLDLAFAETNLASVVWLDVWTYFVSAERFVFIVSFLSRTVDSMSPLSL